jgi:energy-coupling factor transport system permease protein
MITTSLLTLCTLPTSITDGIEGLLLPLKKFKFPVHEFAMMITIAIRFIPTISEEIEKIIKAQSSRGVDFETKNLIKKLKYAMSILVPLLANSFRRADELAIAMECRCYRGDENRSKFKKLKLKRIDLYACFTIIAFICFVLIFKNYKMVKI